MNKREYDTHIVFDIKDITEVEKIDLKGIDKPYSFLLVENKGDFTYRTVLQFNIEREILGKIRYKEDLNGYEVQCIEYDKNDNLIRRTEYENYPNGETKWLYSYDDEGNLFHKQFFEQD